MNWTAKKPKKGDIIRTKVKFYYHYGIFADNDTVIQFGLRDNSGINPDDICVLTTDIAAFSGGEAVETAELSLNEKFKRKSADETVHTAMSLIGTKGYNILHNNCEHFANKCVFGQAHSSFLEEARTEIRRKLSSKKN